MYKLLQIYDNKYYSFNQIRLNSNVLKEHVQLLSLEYKVNEWTYPIIKNSKLFVFEGLSDLQEFYINCYCNKEPGRYAVFRCECKNPKPQELIYYSKHIPSIAAFWKFKHSIDGFDVLTAPTGSYGADAIKLIEEIPSSKIWT